MSQIPGGYCRDCQHWERVDGFDLGECALARFDSEVPSPPPSLARASDHEEYKAHLWTEGHFGCVQFEEASIPDVRQGNAPQTE